MKLFSNHRLPWGMRPREDAFDIGNKQPLSEAMRRELVKHLPYLAAADLDAYSFERRSSAFLQAKCDLFVFDAEGRPVIEGREFFGGPIVFWPRRGIFAADREPDERMHLPPRKKLA